MIRVAGADPGTSSLDLLILEDGAVAEQGRFGPEELHADPSVPVRWLEERGRFDLIAGPSGYGLPLVRARDCTERDLALMTLVRPDDRGPSSQGVLGFRGVVRALVASSLPVVFLPGVIHLPTVPAHRKVNRIDLGTADKLSVAALALDEQAARGGADHAACTFGLVELGSAFTAVVVVAGGRIVDGVGGTAGPVGWRSGGAWDGEVAYLFSPLGKRDLFAGGAGAEPAEFGWPRLRESLLKSVAGLQVATPFTQLILSGRLLEQELELAAMLASDLARLGAVSRLPSLPGAWVKQAAQGAALLADGLAGGARATLVEHLELRGAVGTVLDGLRHPRAAAVRDAFGVNSASR